MKSLYRLQLIRKNILFILLATLFFTGFSSNAQKLNYGIGIQPKFGYLIAHRATMGHLANEHTYGVELSGSIQTNGYKQWHHDFLFPRITFSAFYSSMGNLEILGNAYGTFGALYLPFFRKNNWTFGSNLGAGIAYVTKRYDVVSNPKNNAIGSAINCYASIGLAAEKSFKNHAIGVEVNMSHLSNGAFQLPNLGTNHPTLKLSYFYYFNPLEYSEEATLQREGQDIGTWRFFTQLIGSVKEIYPTGGRKYGVVGLSNFTNYKVKNKFIAEGGIDVIYNSSIIPYNGGGHKGYKNIQAGVYLAYVLPVHRLHMMVGMGRYLYKPLLPEGMWYHKFGARFQITERLWANVTIRSQWAKAEFFEYGLIFRW